MNNDFTAINRNLRNLTRAIQEQNKRMREINSNLTQILYIVKEFRDAEMAEDEEEVNELRVHDLEGNEYVIRGAAIDAERPERSYEECFNRVHGRIVTEGMDCEDTEND